MSGASAARKNRPRPSAPGKPRPAEPPSRLPDLRWWLLGALAAVIVVSIAIVVSRSGGDEATAIEGVRSYSDLPRNHVTEPVDYAQTPPVGGNHTPVWQNCGVYPEPVPNETGVHSMEHGAVWITYGKDLPAADVATLQALGRSQTYVLVSPFDGLPSPLVLTAWGKQLELTSADDPRLEEFLSAYRQGPQTPEPGAACRRCAPRWRRSAGTIAVFLQRGPGRGCSPSLPHSPRRRSASGDARAARRRGSGVGRPPYTGPGSRAAFTSFGTGGRPRRGGRWRCPRRAPSRIR